VVVEREVLLRMKVVSSRENSKALAEVSKQTEGAQRGLDRTAAGATKVQTAWGRTAVEVGKAQAAVTRVGVAAEQAGSRAATAMNRAADATKRFGTEATKAGQAAASGPSAAGRIAGSRFTAGGALVGGALGSSLGGIGGGLIGGAVQGGAAGAVLGGPGGAAIGAALGAAAHVIAAAVDDLKQVLAERTPAGQRQVGRTLEQMRSQAGGRFGPGTETSLWLGGQGQGFLSRVLESSLPQGTFFGRGSVGGASQSLAGVERAQERLGAARAADVRLGQEQLVARAEAARRARLEQEELRITSQAAGMRPGVSQSRFEIEALGTMQRRELGAAQRDLGGVRRELRVEDTADLRRREADALGRVREHSQALIELERRRLDVIQESSRAEQERLGRWRDWANQARDHYRSIAEAERSRLQGLREEFGMMTSLEQAQSLHVARRLSRGEALTGEEGEFFGRHRGMFGEMGRQRIGQQAEAAGFQELIRITGQDRQQREAERAAAQAQAISVAVENRINVEIRTSEELAQQISQQIIAKLMQLAATTRDQVNQALDRQRQEQREAGAARGAAIVGG
jgi:hypothetical protein